MKEADRSVLKTPEEAGMTRELFFPGPATHTSAQPTPCSTPHTTPNQEQFQVEAL